MSPKLDIALLGQLKIAQTPENDKPVDQSALTTKEQALIAYLLITGAQYTRDQLAGLFWRDDPDDKAKNSLRVALSHIRQLHKECITKGNGHRVSVNPAVVHSLDLTEFNQIVQANAEIGSASQPVSIDRAVALYRGDLLAGLHINDAANFQAWLEMERTQHRKNYLRLLESQTIHLLNSRAFAQARELLQSQLRLEPWNEAAHRQLMSTLCRLGDFNAALAQYEICREQLKKELSVEPMPETQQLRERILVARNSPRHNLPAEMQPFVGRPTETSELTDLLMHSNQRLITIVGLGGIGKTRFALHVARRICKGQTVEFINGVFFVSLVAVRSTDQLLALISEAVNPSAVTSNLAQALDQLRSKEMLLILDDWESFIHSLQKFRGGEDADATDLICILLQHCPDLKILVTSREPLGLFAEKRLELQGLDIPPPEADSIEHYSAARLFAQVGQQIVSDFYISAANREPIIQICETLGGMPLAIELAATWLSVMSCQRIADEILRLDFFDTEIQGVPERQRSLRAIFDQSWQMMTHAERDLFRQLAVFAGTFSEDAACAVASTTHKELMSLMKRSLLHRTFFQNEIDIHSTIQDDGFAQHSSTVNDELPMYYSLHSVMRQFAREKLAESKDVQFVMRQEHCSYYVAFLQQQQERLFTDEHHNALALLTHDRQNVLSAWSWALNNMLYDELEVILDISEQFLLVTGFFEEAELTMRRSTEYLYSQLEELENPDPRAQHILGRCLAVQARFQLELSQFESARFTADQLYALSTRIRNDKHLAFALHYQSAANYRLGNMSQARTELEQSLRLAQDNEMMHLIAINLQKLGAIYKADADYEQALSHWQQGLEVRRSINDQHGEIGLLNNLGVIAIQQGDYEQAHTYYQDAYKLSKITGDRGWVGFMLNNIGRIYAEQRDFTRSMRELNDALSIEHSLNNKLSKSNVLLSLGRNYMFLGQYKHADDLHQQALKIKQSIGEKHGEIETLIYLALLHCLRNSPLLALEHITQASAILEQSHFSFLSAQMLTVRSHILLHQNYISEAQNAAQQAMDAWLGLGNKNLSMEPLAYLARSELALGNNKKAFAHVETILTHLKSNNLDGVNFPLHIYLICYDVLAALNDPRAEDVLTGAYDQLKKWANAIKDDALRESYLSINHHRKIVELSAEKPEGCLSSGSSKLRMQMKELA